MRRYLFFVTQLLSSPWTIAVAQYYEPPEHQPRHGFWFGMGLGYGPATFACDSCDYSRTTANSARINGGTVSFGLGGTPSPRFLVGIEYRVWLHGQSNDSIPTIETVSLLFAMYARKHGGPFLEGGLGWSQYSLQKAPADLIERKSGAFVSGGGLALNFGVGWDLGVFSPRIAYSLANEGQLEAAGDGPVATGWRHKVLLLELGLRGHP